MGNYISQNRAEEIGFDLWEDFVVPPFYDSLDLLTAKKPRVIIGGRGCGKTSLLRYLCHQTQFSNKRSNINTDELSHIGVYWKIDTQFAKILSKRGVDNTEWQGAFEHMAVLIICQEILKSLESVAQSVYQGFHIDDLENFDFGILTSFKSNIPNKFYDLKQYIRKEFNFFQTWAGSVKTVDQPVFLPKNFAKELIEEIKSQNATFKDANYFVYIDEYENLLTEQQTLINTWLKHSEAPLIFNLAMKRYSFHNKQTVGNESISDIQDFRQYDLEQFYNAKISFELFAAEILFLRLWKNDKTTSIPIVPDELRSTEKATLQKRLSATYKRKVLESAKKFLPELSHEEIAEEIFTDKVLLNRLSQLLKNAIGNKDSNISIKDLLSPDYPTASIVMTSLLSRNNLPPREILIEFKKLKEGKDNKFTGKTSWIHNNLVGCILLLYEPLGRFCPLYSGFNAFCMMSKTNLRHFLELCNKSLINESLSPTSDVKSINTISIKSQSEAAKQSSTSFLKEVKTFGNNGNALYTFVLRLGTYFKYAHTKATQSEPEQNHFSVKETLNSDIQIFINDAIKWSVLYESKITKQKGGRKKLEVDDSEYILNPIYAPYFHISYRKKRRVKFSLPELNIIVFGNVNDFESFLNKSFKSNETGGSINLFESY